jgi:hypothetical protein
MYELTNYISGMSSVPRIKIVDHILLKYRDTNRDVNNTLSGVQIVKICGQF